ncbi:hypothetical protein, partial [Cernens ardua]|uniref:hypothetical protein n=1 Tax=Cernens ardua TaxID=3402176 RepID=UPI003F9B7A8C
SADGSVGLPHVRVGHRQASIPENPLCRKAQRVFFLSVGKLPGTSHVECSPSFLFLFFPWVSMTAWSCGESA